MGVVTLRYRFVFEKRTQALYKYSEIDGRFRDLYIKVEEFNGQTAPQFLFVDITSSATQTRPVETNAQYYPEGMESLERYPHMMS